MNIGYHLDLTREALLEYGLSTEITSMKLSILGNAYTDIFQEDAIEYVYDDEFCEDAKFIVECLHFDNMANADYIKKYFHILTMSSRERFIKYKETSNIKEAMMLLGSTLHIIQDFYAHSNWVELNVRQLASDVSKNLDLMNTFNPSIKNEIIKLSSLNDPTYFDMDEETLTSIMKGIKYIERYNCVDGNGLFTHCYKYLRPDHDHMNKDYAGRPYFDWAYRAAFRASVQWIGLVKSWLSETLWNKILIYKGEDLSSSSTKRGMMLINLDNITSMDSGGKIFEIFQAVGAWKGKKSRRSNSAIKFNYATDMDFMTSGDTPSFGSIWKTAIKPVSSNLFENSIAGKLVFLKNQVGDPYKDISKSYMFDLYWMEICNYFGIKLSGKGDTYSNHSDEIKEKLRDMGFDRFESDHRVDYRDGIIDILLKNRGYPGFEAAYALFESKLSSKYNSFDQTSLTASLNYLKSLSIPDYSWFKINIPACNSYDSCENNDLYVKTTVNNIMYREAEYLDNDDPNPCWTILHPIKPAQNQSINVEIAFREDDESFTGDDDTMDFTGNGDLQFTYSISNDIIECANIKNSYITKQKNTFLLIPENKSNAAAIYAGMMSNNRIEFIINVNDEKNSGTDDSLYADVGSSVYYLDNQEANDLEKDTVNIFTYDPGKDFTKKDIHKLSIIKDRGDDDGLNLFSVSTVLNNDELMKDNGIFKILDNDNLIYDSSFTDIGTSFITPKEGLQPLKNFLLKITTRYNYSDEYNGTDDDIFFSLLDKDGKAIPFDTSSAGGSTFQLTKNNIICNPLKNKFENGNMDSFYFEIPNTNMIPLYNISFIQITKKGNDDWTPISIEVWTNNKLLINTPVGVKFKNGTVWKSPLINVARKLMCDASMNIFSRGIMSTTNNIKAHCYEVRLTVISEGFNSPSFDASFVTAIPNGFIKKVEQRVEQNKAYFIYHIFIHKDKNNLYKYDIKLTARDVQNSSTVTKKIAIPLPVCGIRQIKSVKKGRQNPNIREDIFEIGLECIHSNFAYNGNIRIDWNFTESLSTQIDGAKAILSYKIPPFTYSYPVSVKVSDEFGIQQSECSFTLKIPNLSAKVQLDFSNSSKKHTLNELPSLSGFSKNATHVIIGESFKQLKVSFVPFYEIDGEEQPGYVTRPISYTWKLIDKNNKEILSNNRAKVPTVSPTVQKRATLAQISNESLKELDTSDIHLQENTPIKEWISSNALKVFDKKIFSFDVDLSSLSFKDIYKLEITINDGIGQQYKFEQRFMPIQGDIGKKALKLGVLWTKTKYPDIFTESILTNHNYITAIDGKTNNLSSKTISIIRKLKKEEKENAKILLILREMSVNSRSKKMTPDEKALFDYNGMKLLEYLGKK